jgi:hypothetical protein
MRELLPLQMIHPIHVARAHYDGSIEVDRQLFGPLFFKEQRLERVLTGHDQTSPTSDERSLMDRLCEHLDACAYAGRNTCQGRATQLPNADTELMGRPHHIEDLSRDDGPPFRFRKTCFPFSSTVIKNSRCTSKRDWTLAVLGCPTRGGLRSGMIIGRPSSCLICSPASCSRLRHR